jgi:hypothetical protein
MLNERGGTEKREIFIAPKTDSQQVVKPDEVIHVSVCHKHVGDFEQISWGKGM